MADTVEEIKGRLGIVEVVSQYVQLTQKGRNFKGLCPFHSEKTPSFVVSPEKQICHCFGCNKGGDIFTFIQEIEGIEFVEALQVLGDRAGVKVEHVSKHKHEGKGEKDEYFKAHDLACDFFQDQLNNTNDGKKVLEYLKKRGLNSDTITDFKIGFSPDKFDSLYPYLIKKGISKKVLVKSGFVSSKGIASDDVYDKFRGRLMFPIFDYMGRVCGFGGRALNKDQMPKYLNSPENPIYSKSKVLYGLYHSKNFVKELDSIIMVEGYFDVLVPFQEGVRNIAAVSGTALTEQQAILIKRLTENVVTCFDLDEAGFGATRRSFSVLRKEGVLVKTVGGFEGKDPADLVLSEGGEAFRAVVDGALDFVSFYIEKLISRNDVSSFEGRRAVLQEMLPLYMEMSSSAKDFYVRELATKLNMQERFLYDEIQNFRLPTGHPARKTSSGVSERDSSEGFSLDEVICSLVLDNPNLFKKLLEIADENDFHDEAKDIYKQLQDQYNTARNDFNKWNFEKDFTSSLRRKIDILLIYAEEKYGHFSEESLQNEVEKLVDKVRQTRRSVALRGLQEKISEAEKADDKEGLIKYLKEQQVLLSE